MRFTEFKGNADIATSSFPASKIESRSIGHITLIRTPIVSSVNSFSAPITAPLALAYLSASLIRAGFTVTPIDAIGEAIDHVFLCQDPPCRVRGLSNDEIIRRIPPQTQLIAVSCMFSQEWLVVRNVIKAIKKVFPAVPVVLGGEHATAVPREILESTPEVALCAVGEGEETIIDIARNFYNDLQKIPGIVFRGNGGEIIRTGARTRIQALEKIPRPAWHLLPIEVYLQRGVGVGISAGRNMPILATRGCPFQCTFCSNKGMWTQRYYTRDPEDVVDEIEGYIRDYKIDMVEFFDLTAIVKKDWILQFGKLLKERNIHIKWSLPSGTRSEALDEEVVKLLAETNCHYLVYAAESGSVETLKDIKKEVKLDRMMSSMKAAKRNGLSLRCNLMMGFPKEERKDVWKTLWFQLKLAFLGVDDAPIFMFSPYPGTELFNYLCKTGKIPSMDENYYRSLICQMDLTQTSTYCENIGPKELAFYRVLGMSVFYFISYLFYPQRIIRSIRNIFGTKKTATVFEQRIVELLNTREQIKRRAGTPGVVSALE